MQTEPPRTIAERSVSCGKDDGPQIALLHVMAKQFDQTPIKPSRKSWNDGEDSDADSITYALTGDDEKSSDGSVAFSDLTDPTAFNNSMSHFIDDSWRQDSFDVSVRIEALGPLEEEQNDVNSFEVLRSSSKDRAVFETEGKDTPPQLAPRRTRSGSKDRSVFETEGKDTPPQLAQRSRSGSDEWSEHSEPMADCRFGKIAPVDQDKPMTLPLPSYSQQVSIPTPSSALSKLAQVFRSGCVTGTHTYHLKKYPNTFVGSDAVDFMLSANLASTREDAVFLGQRFFKELNLFHHVYWDHTFKDGLYFYRFSDQSGAPISKEGLAWICEKFVKGMPVSNHMKRRFKTYEGTFLGDEAVNYMLQASLVTSRSEAVFLGQRMMEELEIFEPVAHHNRFKDTCYLYRFLKGDIETLGGDESTKDASLGEHIGSQQCTSQSVPLSPVGSAQCKTNSRVSFGLVQIRCFERCLDVNPATEQGPSLGLGWRFYDDSPVSLGDKNPEVYDFWQGLLSSKDRKAILKAWGYSKAEIGRATRANKTIRKQRKRSLNE